MLSLLNPVANKLDYIATLRAVINRLHGCLSVHVETVPVHETFNGKTIWNGDVEVFNLVNHAKANRAYAWAHLYGENDETTRYVTILELPPVRDAKTAVQAWIMSDTNTPKS